MTDEGSGSTGPGSGESTAEASGARAASTTAAPRSRGRIALAAIVAAVLIGVGAFAAGWLAAPRVPTPGDTSVEAGFARDMQEHHNQAVEMAMIIRQQTDDPEISSLAYDIATSQANQSGQMYGWLNSWGLPQASSQPSMTWMLQPTLDDSDAHAHGGSTAATADPSSSSTAAAGTAGTEPMVPGGTMPGMASSDDIARLSTLSGVEAERLFLELMIAHHQGGVEMADAAIARTTNPLVLALANAVVFAQTGEITYMQELLAARQ
ncbi:MAG: DUF305 domain-containing protein [Herbiconiux sp.]|uniref:DUF305 domain-containing protein n=1 Tax=Herbiconiux sp. TaxID=1871186 RepID=UPI001225898A|nr:DUF305 domain-containing protein [Herbiconiux sp.]TAJ47975.1 MAG: DUF305 domain-containing protein [Herbiconiux sp.]